MEELSRLSRDQSKSQESFKILNTSAARDPSDMKSTCLFGGFLDNSSKGID